MTVFRDPTNPNISTSLKYKIKKFGFDDHNFQFENTHTHTHTHLILIYKQYLFVKIPSTFLPFKRTPHPTSVASIYHTNLRNGGNLCSAEQIFCSKF